MHVQQMDLLFCEFSLVKNTDNVGVIKLSERLGLVAFASRHFEGDQTVHGKLVRKVDVRESALSKFLDQQKIIDLSAQRKFWRWC